MSDPTITINEYDAAREREALATEYRAAYRAARLKRSAGLTKQAKTIAAKIHAAPGIFAKPDTPENFIDGIERDVEYELNVEIGRVQIADALTGADEAVSKVRRTLQLAAEYGDLEAELTPEMTAAFTGIDIHLAALRHFLRYALPDGMK